MSFLATIAFGFALGMRHATDSDHIAAVGTMAANGRSARGAAAVGAWWGVGHATSVLLVGGALVLLRLPMPVRVALALEFAVALMLIALGVRSLLARRQKGDGQASALRPLIVGVVHGLAGSAVLALLVISTTDSALVAAAYLVCFCVGTTAGMAVVSALFALPARLGASRAITLEHAVRVVAGVASIGVGISIAHRVGVEDGLFGALPPIGR